MGTPITQFERNMSDALMKLEQVRSDPDFKAENLSPHFVQRLTEISGHVEKRWDHFMRENRKRNR